MEISCLLYTSDAADERSSVDLGGRRIIKKKTKMKNRLVYKTNKKQRKASNKHAQNKLEQTKLTTGK